MKEVLNMDEACEFLGLAKPTLYKYVRQGSIPAFKVGRVWKFHKESLNDWIKQQVKDDTSSRSQMNKKRKKGLATSGKGA